MSIGSIPQARARWSLLDPALLNGVLPVTTLMRVAARWTPATGRQLLRPVRILADGSYEALVLAQAGTPIRVRVLEYVLSDPVRDPTGDRQRLVTTLLDPVAHPALDLIALYHERWEIEIRCTPPLFFSCAPFLFSLSEWYWVPTARLHEGSCKRGSGLATLRRRRMVKERSPRQAAHVRKDPIYGGCLDH